MKTMLKALLVIAALGFCMLPAHADQLFVCQSCTTPPGGNVVGGEGNFITDTSGFNVGVAGGAALDNPLIIIVAVYNDDGVPSISFGATPSEPAAPIGTYGLTKDTASLTSGTVFEALGLSAGGSVSFGNLSDSDVANGFAAPTDFSLYAFEVPTSLGGANNPITIDESGAAQGSFILAYDCKAGTGSSEGCAKNGDRSQTVATNMGLIDSAPPQVPEPSSLGLLGLGLLGLMAFTIRRPAANLI